MKKLLFIITALLMSCTFAKEYKYVCIRNMAETPVIYEYWLSGIAFELQPGEEIETLVCKDEIRILTPWGVAFADVREDNTIELSEIGYYWGEELYNYWNEGR